MFWVPKKGEMHDGYTPSRLHFAVQGRKGASDPNRPRSPQSRADKSRRRQQVYEPGLSHSRPARPVNTGIAPRQRGTTTLGNHVHGKLGSSGNRFIFFELRTKKTGSREVVKLRCVSFLLQPSSKYGLGTRSCTPKQQHRIEGVDRMLCPSQTRGVHRRGPRPETFPQSEDYRAAREDAAQGSGQRKSKAKLGTEANLSGRRRQKQVRMESRCVAGDEQDNCITRRLRPKASPIPASARA